MDHDFNPQDKVSAFLEETPAKPFIIEHLRRDQTKSGYFTPGAQVVLTSALRTSGLLLALPAEDIKNLLFLLSFVTPNGHVLPSVQELAAAMHVSEAKVRMRMQRLCQFEWQGQPLASEITRETGMDGYTLSREAVAVEEAAQPPMETAAPPLPPTAGREAVIAYSRQHYTRPRAEVERQIAEQMGWTEKAVEGPEGEVRRRLIAMGVTREQIDALLARHSLEDIQRQLDWLPYRHAKSPVRFLIAAIEGSYEPPATVRLEQALAAHETVTATAGEDHQVVLEGSEQKGVPVEDRKDTEHDR